MFRIMSCYPWELGKATECVQEYKVIWFLIKSLKIRTNMNKIKKELMQLILFQSLLGLLHDLQKIAADEHT